MTPPASSAGVWDIRVRRAEELASRYPFAAEVLRFYKHVASFQKYLYEKINAFEERSATGGPGAVLRGEMDFALVLPHFREYLRVVEQHAPLPLKEKAREMAAHPPDSWIPQLQAYWEQGGKSGWEEEALQEFFARSVLQPYAEYRAMRMAREPLYSTRLTCPLCESQPVLGALRAEGDGGKRFLLCACCGLEWEFRRILCAKCGEQQEAKLPIYVAEQFPHIRMECCETCKHYLRTIDLTKDGHAVPVVDDLAALPLSLWAEEHGYRRILGNLLGT